MKNLSTLSALGTVGFEQLRYIIAKDNSGLKEKEIKKVHRELFALGHINNDYIKRKAEILPPLLLPLARIEKNNHYRVILIGFRNKGLLLKIMEIATCNNIKVIQENNQNLPDRILLIGSNSEIQKVVNELKEYKISLFCDLQTPGSWIFLHQTETLQEKMSKHKKECNSIIVQNEINNFDVYCPDKNVYVKWENLKKTYRCKLMLIRRARYKYWIAYKTEAEKWELCRNDFQGDLSFVKWAIIQSEGSPISKYIQVSTDLGLCVSVKYPLPLQYHRILCLCSGFIPVLKNQNLLYSNVPEIIGQEILNKIKYTNC